MSQSPFHTTEASKLLPSHRFTEGDIPSSAKQDYLDSTFCILCRRESANSERSIVISTSEEYDALHQDLRQLFNIDDSIETYLRASPVHEYLPFSGYFPGVEMKRDEMEPGLLGAIIFMMKQMEEIPWCFMLANK